MGTPVWLLDVDGVINCSHPGWPEAPYRRRVHADHEYRLRWSPSLMRRIRRLLSAGQVEIRWCATWCPWAHLLEDAFHLPELPRALSDDQAQSDMRTVDRAKYAAAVAVRETEGRRLIWTDDSAVPRLGPELRRLVADRRALLLAPAGRAGLLPVHMDLIEAFVAA